MDDNSKAKDNITKDEIKLGNILEYETQFFGFTPQSFLDGVHNAVSDYVSDCFGELEKQLASEPSLTKRCTPEQIHQKTDAMLTRFYQSVDQSSDRLEIFLLMCTFKIPPEVLLPEDKIHEGHNYTKEEETRIDHELLELQRKIKAAKYVNTALKQEVKELDAMESQITECSTYLDNLNKTCQTGLGLKESLKYNFDQAMKLHDMLNAAKEGGLLPVVQESQGDTACKSARKKIKIG